MLESPLDCFLSTGLPLSFTKKLNPLLETKFIFVISLQDKPPLSKILISSCLLITFAVVAFSNHRTLLLFEILYHLFTSILQLLSHYIPPFYSCRIGLSILLACLSVIHCFYICSQFCTISSSLILQKQCAS